VATAEVVRDFPLSLKGGAAKAKIVSATRRKQHASRAHTGGQAVRYPAVSVVSQVLRLRQVSAVRRLRMLDDREIFVRNCEYVVFGE